MRMKHLPYKHFYKACEHLKLEMSETTDVINETANEPVVDPAIESTTAEPHTPSTLKPPANKTKYAKLPGFYFGCVASLILLLMGGIIVINSIKLDWNVAGVIGGLSILYLGGFGAFVLLHPVASAGTGRPKQLNYIYGAPLLFSIFVTLHYFQTNEFEFSGTEVIVTISVAFAAFLFALIVVLPVRFVLGMEDKGPCMLIRSLKPWRILAPEEQQEGGGGGGEKDLHVRQLGFYLGLLASLICCIGAVYISVNFPEKPAPQKWLLFLATAFLGSFIFNAMMAPELTAAQGNPTRLNSIFLFNFLVILAFISEQDIQGILVFGIGSLLVTLPIRIIWSLKDEGPIAFLHTLKPWKLVADVESRDSGEAVEELEIDNQENHV